MDYIHSNSQESLSSKIRDITHNDSITKELMDYVRESCEKRSLDIEKVSEAVLVAINRTSEIRSVGGFVKKIVINLDEKTFKKSKITPMFTSLNKALYKNGIIRETWELFLIHSIEEHCLNEFHITAEDLTITNRAIVEYCKMHDIKTLKEFKDLLLKSKVLKNCNVPIAVLEAQAKEHGATFDRLAKDLEEDDSLYGKSEEY